MMYDEKEILVGLVRSATGGIRVIMHYPPAVAIDALEQTVKAIREKFPPDPSLAALDGKGTP